MFAALVAQAFTRPARAGALAQARAIAPGGRGEHAQLRARGAARSRSSPRAALTLHAHSGDGDELARRVRLGARLSPRQSWNLVDTTLSWQAGRWLVAAMNTERTPAPVPAIVFVDGDNNQSAAFDAPGRDDRTVLRRRRMSMRRCDCTSCSSRIAAALALALPSRARRCGARGHAGRAPRSRPA